MTLANPVFSTQFGSRRTEELILEARKLAYQENYSFTEGWDDNTMVDVLNRGLDQLYGRITAIDSPANIMEWTSDVIATQTDYQLPLDVQMAIRIVDVRYLYATTFQPWAFITLRQGMIQDRFAYPTNIPDTYCIRDGKIILSPAPNNTKTQSLVINFQKRMRRMDIRRGKVSGFTLGTPPTSTTFQLNFNVTSQKDANLQANANSILDNVDYCCLVDDYGNPLVNVIPIQSYNQSTFVLTTLPNYVMPASEQAALNAALAPGSGVTVYVVSGDYSSSHSELDRQSEDYIIEYMRTELLRLQSNVEPSEVQIALMNDMLDRLVNNYRRVRPTVYPVVWQERLRPRSWPWGRRGMY